MDFGIVASGEFSVTLSRAKQQEVCCRLNQVEPQHRIMRSSFDRVCRISIVAKAKRDIRYRYDCKSAAENDKHVWVLLGIMAANLEDPSPNAR